MSKFQQLFALLQGYTPDSSQQLQFKQRFLDFIQTELDCLERSCLFGHITASAWVLDSETHSRVLLVEHKKFNCWLQPGGHADGDLDVVAVAQRELQEETGIIGRLLSPDIFDLDIHEIPAYKEVPSHLHFDLRFLFEADSSIALVCSEESHAVRWFDLIGLAKLACDESILRMATKSQDKKIGSNF